MWDKTQSQSIFCVFVCCQIYTKKKEPETFLGVKLQSHLERINVVRVPVFPAHGVHQDWILSLAMVTVWPKLAMFSDSIRSSTRPHWAARVPSYCGALASPGGAHADDAVVGADGVRPANNNIILMLLISGYYTDPGSEQDSDFLSLLKDKLPNLVLEGRLSPVKFIWITLIFLPWLLNSQECMMIKRGICWPLLWFINVIVICIMQPTPLK